VAGKFFDALLDLLGSNYLAKGLDSGCIHETALPPVP
jgi:hypothetical protein